MSRPTQLAVALAMATLAGTVIDENQPAKTLSPEEREKWRRDREARDEADRRDRAACIARYQAEQDAIAAPFREARRLRNLKKLQQGQIS